MWALKMVSQSDLTAELLWLDLMHRVLANAGVGVAITDSIQSDDSIICMNSAFEYTGYAADEVMSRNGNLTHFIGIQTDITERQEAKAQLRSQQEEVQKALRKDESDLWAIVENMSDGLVVVSQEGEVIFVNHASEKLFNRSATQLLGQSLGIPITTNNRAEIDIFPSGQNPTWVEFSCSAICWQGLPAYLIALREITKHRQIYDPLTRLPTRILFYERLQHVIELSRRRDDFSFALLFIDLDRFKVVNDSLGHGTGDQLLVHFARRIQDQLRACDMLARLSGDEFAILLEELNHSDDVTKVAERINLALTYPFELDGCEVFTSASIGIALGRPDLEKPEDLIREADTAMYRAKAKGRACYAIFDQEMHAQAMLRLQLETDLRHAIERQELMVYYQPIIALNSNQLLGFEALLRWYNPHKGWVSPELFIPIAEETGLIINIGQYVLKKACQQVQYWLSQNLLSDPFTISVNLSSKQLSQPDLVKQILQTLEETGLAPHYLQLEITESLLMENPTAAASIFQELEANSIRLAMDDFGTGYSSLNYLRRFPVHTLKIDRSFTHRLGTQEEDLEIVQTIISLANNLKMTVVAEGIENETQLSYLQTIGCGIGQGFLFAKAMNPQAVSDFLLQQDTR